MDINSKIYDNLTRQQLFEILEYVYNEIYVVDKDMTVIYVNPACTQNYGILPEEFIGKNHNQFTGDIWFPSILPTVFLEKRRMCVEQVTYTGKKILSTATPVFDDNNEIEMVVCVTEEKFEILDIQYNKEEDIINYITEEADDDLCDSPEIICPDKGMAKLYTIAKRSSKKNLPVLIQGESGTGKSMLAKYIHDSSNRKNGLFLSVNCAAISPELVESELFGYAPHAFTGANPKGKVGLIEAADKGTLFLDEIGELSLSLQAKLLDVLENKEFIPIGGKAAKFVDVRFISATNKNLAQMVESKQFREDLFWRLNVVDITIPPLRERTADITALCVYFLEKNNLKYNTNKKFSQNILNIFVTYHWPGNVRQLKNIIERCVIVSQNDEITMDDLPSTIRSEINDKKNSFISYQEYMDAAIAQIVNTAYAKAKTTTTLAKALNVSQPTASRLIKKHITTGEKD